MTDTQTIDKSEKRPHHQNKTKRLGMGVKVREKIKGSGVWWVFVNHNRQRISKRVGSKKAALQVRHPPYSTVLSIGYLLN